VFVRPISTGGLGGVGWGPDTESISATRVRFRIQLTFLVGRAIDASMKHLAILIALLLPVAAWAQRTPLSNNSQPITAAPSIPNRTGTIGTGLAGTNVRRYPRQRIPKPANRTCRRGWASSGRYCVKI
jgi:hypothetical protein